MCTPQETGSLIAAERAGIPAITVAAPGFMAQVYSTAMNNGIPAPRAAMYPGAFAAHTIDELIANTREILWPRIIDALTKPITEEEIAERTKEIFGPGAGEIAFSGTMDEVNEYFTKMQWSDGLPIVPPTVEKIEEFLRYTDRPWDETVGIMPIAYRDTKVWHVAVNGVMAGCPPEYMPILLAYTKALADPDQKFDLGSTHSWIPYAWINGPVSRQLGIDSGQGMIAEPQNMVLGRFISLTAKNIAGYYIKQDRMGSFGYPMSWAFAENEELCKKIGWDPYHVQQGFELNQSTLTGSSSLVWGNNLIPCTADPQKIMELMAWDIVEKQRFSLGSGTPFTFRTILMTSYTARDLSWQYTTKEELEADLVNTARRTAYERAFANYYANPGSQPAITFEEWLEKTIASENGMLTKMPPWFPELPGVDQVMTVPTMASGKTAFLVAGDPDRNKVQCMPGGNFITVEIELPTNWDSLMADIGYPPLQEFFLE